MTADQRKAGDVMVEGNFLPPTGLRMALLATRAELSFVRIVLFVARRAIHRELVAIEIARMTRIAFDPGMPAAQRKLGCLVVIEVHGLPLIRIVAGLALGAVLSAVGILQPVT